MRFKFGFVVIDRLLHLFLWLMLLFAVMVFAVLWFFEIDLTAHGTGLVKCETWVDVKPQVSGIIREMKVKEGQWVSKGDVLFVFEDRERKLEVDGTALRIAELKIAIAKSRNRLELAEEKISGEIDETRASLDAAKAQYRIIRKGPKPEELELARTRVSRYEIQAEKAARDSDQRQRAYSLKLISKQDMENAVHHERLAEADLKMIRGELNLLKNRYDADQIAVAKAEVDRCQAIYAKTLARKKERGILRKDLEGAAKSLEKEEKRLAVLQEHVMLTRINASIDGYVLSHDTEHLVGEAVVEGEVVLRLGDSRQFIIDCRVSEKDVPLIVPGQKAKVQIKPFPRGEYRLFSATVARVGASINRTGPGGRSNAGAPNPGWSGSSISLNEGLFPVILKLDRPYTVDIYGDQYRIKPGFSAEVEIITRRERIVHFVLRRVLRIKGKLVPKNLHL